MSRYKCPACGSRDTVRILYGEPTYEAYLASEQGELILGGSVFRIVAQPSTVNLVDKTLVARIYFLYL